MNLVLRLIVLKAHFQDLEKWVGFEKKKMRFNGASPMFFYVRKGIFSTHSGKREIRSQKASNVV